MIEKFTVTVSDVDFSAADVGFMVAMLGTENISIAANDPRKIEVWAKAKQAVNNAKVGDRND